MRSSVLPTAHRRRCLIGRPSRGCPHPNDFHVTGNLCNRRSDQKVTQKTAFGRGTLYFRHGAKSESGTSADVTAVIEREVASVKEFWLEGIAKVVAAPPGATVQVLLFAVRVSETIAG